MNENLCLQRSVAAEGTAAAATAAIKFKVQSAEYQVKTEVRRIPESDIILHFEIAKHALRMMSS